VWGLKAFVLGTVAIGVVAYAVAAALAVTAQVGGRALELALGPLAVVSVTHGGAGTVTTFGPGLVALALAGGVANLGLARLMWQRSGPPGDRVD
jgi:hypothetical protein